MLSRPSLSGPLHPFVSVHHTTGISDYHRVTPHLLTFLPQVPALIFSCDFPFSPIRQAIPLCVRMRPPVPFFPHYLARCPRLVIEPQCPPPGPNNLISTADSLLLCRRLLLPVLPQSILNFPEAKRGYQIIREFPSRALALCSTASSIEPIRK